MEATAMDLVAQAPHVVLVKELGLFERRRGITVVEGPPDAKPLGLEPPPPRYRGLAEEHSRQLLVTLEHPAHDGHCTPRVPLPLAVCELFAPQAEIRLSVFEVLLQAQIFLLEPRSDLPSTPGFLQ